jgi:hypothetical protein
LRHLSFTVVKKKRQRREFSSPVRNVLSFKLASHSNRVYGISVIYCNGNCVIVLFCHLLSCNRFCFVSLIVYLLSLPPLFFKSSYLQFVFSTYIIRSCWAMTHSSEEHFSYICIFYIQSCRKVHTADNYEGGDDEEHITSFSTEKHFEVKSALLEHLSGRSSSRYVSVIVFLFLLLLCTGRSHLMPGLHSWKILCKSSTKFLLPQCISWGLSDWQPNLIQWMTTWSGHVRTSRVYISVVYKTSTYIFLYIYIQYSYLFLKKWKLKRLTSYVFGMVHSDRPVVILLHKHFGFWLSTFFIFY